MSVRKKFFLVAFILGAIQAWNTRFYMTPDGVSYLDIGDAYFRGDFSNAINAYWSPLYSWILGFVLFICKPSSYYEFPLVHFINFLIFLFSIFSFDFFIKRLSLSVKMYLIACTIFLYTTLKFTNLWNVTPDLLLSCFIYLISGYILKIKSEGGKNSDFIVLGILLGLSYLIKTPMFLLAFVFLLTILIFKIANLQRVLISLIIFLLVCSPFVFLISKEKNRLTFSDSGKLNYVWQVNNVTAFYMVHWQGGVDETRVRGVDKKVKNVYCGKPTHPTRKIYSSPDIYEFENPITATYAPWYDPSYWYEGVKPDLNPKHLFNFLKGNIKDYFLIFVLYQGIFIICFLYFLFKLNNTHIFLSNLKKNLFLIVPPVFIISLYALVYPELRYIASFVCIFWIVVFMSLDFKGNDETENFGSKLLVIFLFITILTSRFTSSDYSYLKDLPNKKNSPVNYEVANELGKIGLHAGDRVASFGYGHLAFWARLGKFRIVTEIPDEEVKKFWSISREKRLEIVEIIKNAGAKAIVVDTMPLDSVLSWRKLGNTGYYVCLIK